MRGDYDSGWSGYSAGHMAKPVHFYCEAPNARAVFLAPGQGTGPTRSAKRTVFCRPRALTRRS
jgi:hypothetical protein